MSAAFLVNVSVPERAPMFIRAATVASRLLQIGVAIALLSASLGCQTWAPTGSFANLASSRQDKKTAQLAEQDPFPSPADLGIE